jgi:hypothetical protein
MLGTKRVSARVSKVGTMSSRLGDSLDAMGVAAVIAVLVLAATWRKFGRVQGRARAAARFADVLGLAALPPEAAERFGRRLYQRAMVQVAFGGMGYSVWTAWYSYNTFFKPESQVRPSSLPPQIYVVPVWAFIGLVSVVGHLYDLMRSSRETGDRVARIVDPPLSDAVPPVLTWLLRVTGAFPAVAACVWFFVPVAAQHGPRAVHPHPVLFAVSAVSGPLCVAVTETAQRRILSSRQHAATPRELAFDDALRVQTALSVMFVPWLLCTGFATATVMSLGRTDSWSGALPVYTAMSIMLLPLLCLPVAVGSKWARRYYIRRFAAYSGAAAC